MSKNKQPVVKLDNDNIANTTNITNITNIEDHKVETVRKEDNNAAPSNGQEFFKTWNQGYISNNPEQVEELMDNKKQNDTVDLDTVIAEQRNTEANDEYDMTEDEYRDFSQQVLDAFSKDLALPIGLSTRDGFRKLLNKFSEDITDEDWDKIANNPKSTEFNTIALTQIPDKQELIQRRGIVKAGKTDEEIKSKLSNAYKNIGDGRTTLNSAFRGRSELEVKKASDLVTLCAITGELRRITLWNSGFAVTLRALPLDLLDKFVAETSHTNYQYGREFGMPYYLFDSLEMDKHVIERLLPAAIVGSSYAGWHDNDKLMNAIAWQDYPVLVWAMGAMMHPFGAPVRFVCAECGNVEQVKADINKLHLLNTDMISDEMAEIISKKTVTDEDLERYRKLCYKDNVRSFGYDQGTNHFEYEITLRPDTLAGHISLGNEFLADLRKNTKELTNRKVVDTHLLYNRIFCYQNWIESAKITITSLDKPDDTPKVVIINREVIPDGEDKVNTMRVLLEILRTNYPQFTILVQKFILDTTISHIAFYKAECSNCHTPPSAGYHGYVPYDPVRAFFTLAAMKLTEIQAAIAKSNISEI